MAEYIDRGALIEWLKRIRLIDLSDGRGLCRVIFEDDFKRAIKEMPKGIIADVTPVRHGRWIERKRWAYGKWSKWIECSECNYADYNADMYEDMPFTFPGNYCPNCGAKMDLEDREDNNANKEID